MATTTVYGGSAQIATNDSDIATNTGDIVALHDGVDDDAIDSKGTLESISGLTVVEKGNAAVHKTIMTLVEVELASTDGTTPLNDGAWGTKHLYTFPEGHVVIHGAHMLCPITKIEAVTGGDDGFADAANIEVGVGTVASAQAVAFGLEDGTQENIIDALDVDLTTKTSDAAETTVNTTSAAYDGSGGSVEMHLNFRTLADGDHGVNPDVLKIGATLTVVWSILGDN